MKPKTLIYALLLSYCLLSSVCLACIIVFWGGFLGDQTTTCREDALARKLPVYPASTLVYDEESGDSAQGTLTRGYTAEDSFDDVAGFYDEHATGGACTRLGNGSSARCDLGHDEQSATYIVEIKTGETQTLYQTVISWNCRGLD